jgi:hypothetical protein
MYSVLHLSKLKIPLTILHIITTVSTIDYDFFKIENTFSQFDFNLMRNLNQTCLILPE